MSVGWIDLTVADASGVRDFYQAVADLDPTPVPMGGYDDYAMCTGGKAIAGICHARGPNVGLPPVWLPYFEVASLEASLDAARARGGHVLTEPKTISGGMRYAVIRDPAGASAALLEKTAAAEREGSS